ncbi:hypothetical protein G7085_15495 [Tessaracoccus sp. HDW20]|nr:hypothetical protein [Tessaracoccus coleopterorum]NHB85536.1 hypothetical protein [Tessaracoccus coleopterorum]
MSLLEVTKLTRNFGGLTAVYEANLHVDTGNWSASSGPTARGRPRCSTC